MSGTRVGSLGKALLLGEKELEKGILVKGMVTREKKKKGGN